MSSSSSQVAEKRTRFEDGSRNNADGKSSSAKPPPLPLDWTRVKRRNNSEDCECDDPFNCSLQHRKRRRAPLSSATVQPSPQQNGNTKTGTAIFCLHESDPQWFQGYFFPQPFSRNNSVSDESSSSSLKNNDPKQEPQQLLSTFLASGWGLLVQQQEIDDCLQCTDGGYRQVSLTVYPFSSTKSDPKRRVKYDNLDWTGGEMMRLLQEQDEIRFEPQQLLTNEKALPFCNSIFQSLVLQLRKEQEESQDVGVLELLPDVAIVVGSMQIVVAPSEENEVD